MSSRVGRASTGYRRDSGGRTEALVEEDVRQLMDVTGDTLITVVVTLVVSGPLAYVIGLAQSRRQRLEDRRAEVIAELFRHLYIVQDAFYMSVAIPQLMNSLIEEFREIINPPPRYVRALGWLETRGKRDDAQQ
jgi:hypothetical protein